MKTLALKSTATLIDHVYTNDLSSKLVPGLIISDISDHLPVFTQIVMNNSVSNPNHWKLRDMHRFDRQQFLYELNIKLKTITNENLAVLNVNKVFSDFVSCFKSTLDRHAPLRNATRKEKSLKNKPWNTPRILNAIKDMNKLYKSIKNKTF